MTCDPVLAEWLQSFDEVQKVITQMEPKDRACLFPWVHEQYAVLAMAIAVMTPDQRDVCNAHIEAIARPRPAH